MADLLVEAAAEGLIAIDEAGRIIAFNAAAGRIFGVEPARMLGQSLEAILGPGSVVGAEAHLRGYVADVARGLVGGRFETEARHSSGRAVPLEVALTPISDAAGPLLLASIIDITERREAAKGRGELMERLAQAQKLEVVGSLTAALANDFNNTLAAIRGYASAVLAELEGGSRHRRDLTHVLTMVRRARRLTDRLLSVSRNDELEVEVLSLTQLVRDVVGFLRRTLPRTIRIETELGRGTHVEGDPTQLEQCLINLCLNARDAMPEGGELRLATRRVRLDEARANELGLAAPGDYCELTVTDDGQGMDPQTLDHAFEPFFSTKPRGAGSGLGLVQVSRAVQAHRGHLRLESRPGKGTRVQVYLPATDEPCTAPTLAPSGVASRTRAAGESILLVEDERYVREMAKRLLEILGYRVLLAPDGEQAVRLYAEQHPHIDLVLLDLVLGAQTGAAVFEELRAIDPQVRVLLCSGLGRGPELQQLLDRGAAGFVQKPFGIDEIHQAIQGALR